MKEGQDPVRGAWTPAHPDRPPIGLCRVRWSDEGEEDHISFDSAMWSSSFSDIGAKPVAVWLYEKAGPAPVEDPVGHWKFGAYLFDLNWGGLRASHIGRHGDWMPMPMPRALAKDDLALVLASALDAKAREPGLVAARDEAYALLDAADETLGELHARIEVLAKAKGSPGLMGIDDVGERWFSARKWQGGHSDGVLEAAWDALGSDAPAGFVFIVDAELDVVALVHEAGAEALLSVLNECIDAANVPGDEQAKAQGGGHVPENL